MKYKMKYNYIFPVFFVWLPAVVHIAVYELVGSLSAVSFYGFTLAFVGYGTMFWLDLIKN